ncbi:MAG: sensor histidine kinase, partial [Acetatifactor sp.]|nr:sensor histidine kinase [Acetatifactor sp.]
MKKIRLHWFTPEHGRLKTKLLCAFFLLVVLPLGLFTLYSYFRIRSVAREQTFSAAQNAFDSSATSVQQALDKLDEVLDILSADPLVYAMASNDPKD